MLKFSKLIALSLIFILSGAAQAAEIDNLQRGFERPPDDARIMMRWWWFGPSVTKPQLEREMRLMKEGGIGGFEIQPVYPLLPDDPERGIKNLPYLSDEFLDALRFTNDKARDLGLRVDLTLGSGWSFGGAKTPITEAAGALRFERVKVDARTRRVNVPSMIPSEKLMGVFLARTDGNAVSQNQMREITDIREGAAYLPSNLENANEVLFFISGKTGMQVKRPSVGAEGYVLNHLDKPSAESYLKNTGDRLMKAFGSTPPYSVFCDSLEVYNQDWTDDFLAEFQRRRGYDLKPFLPALAMDMGAKTADIRYDWGRTITELFNERFMTSMSEWSRRNKTRFRIQGYGIPPAALHSNRLADISDGEGAQWRVVRAARWASSANHIYGRNITSSETWTWLHSPSFRATPLDMKAEADIHFLQGINQLIGHGWAYTPETVEYPGWRFYAAGEYSNKNPWWIVMPDLAAYLQRVSFLMRQGAPANDVALYLPNADAYAHFSAGKVHLIETERELVGENIMPAIFEAGYNLDFFDDGTLKDAGRVESNSLALGPNKYRVVILPGIERIPLETLRQLDQFVKNGGILIATRRLPNVAPGFKATAEEQNQVREISRRLFEGANPAAHFVKDEKSELKTTLNRLLQPDIAFSPAAADIGFVHRRTADADVYFVANTSNQLQKLTAQFRVTGKQAEMWNPMNGKVMGVSAAPGKSDSSVSLELEPYGSRVIVFSNRKLAAAPANNRATNAAALDLSSGWSVTFGQNANQVSMNQLRSWTDDEQTRYFSGTAVYEREINVPENMLRNGGQIRLDFGDPKPITPQPLKNGMRTWLDAPVKEAAVVYINNQRAGSVWSPPYSLDVTQNLKPGANKIRIVVANTALNHMSGRRLPDYRLLNLRYGERFQPQDMDKVQPLASGLLGSIRLVANTGGRLP